jgi:DNA repair exonuclease SbcCD ATPase subunit
MKYLKKFKYFEAFTVSPTDEPTQKLAKEEINSLEKQLKDFNNIKNEIDTIFSSEEENDEINDKIEEVRDKYQNNQLIDEYVKVANISKKLKDLEKEIADYDKESFEKKEELKEATKGGDPSTIQSKQQIVTEISKKITEKQKEIDLIKKEATVAEQCMKEQMDRIKKDSQRNMANL